MSDRDYWYFEKQVKDTLIYQSEDALVNLTKVYDILEDLKSARAERDALKERVAKLREALGFYYKPVNSVCGDSMNTFALWDYCVGISAREAIAADDEKEKL